MSADVTRYLIWQSGPFALASFVARLLTWVLSIVFGRHVREACVTTLVPVTIIVGTWVLYKVGESAWRAAEIKAIAPSLAQIGDFKSYDLITHVDTDWYPKPWEFEERKTGRLLQRIPEYAGARVARYTAAAEAGRVSAPERVLEWLDRWAGGHRICAALETKFGELPDCGSLRPGSIPQIWQRAFFGGAGRENYLVVRAQTLQIEPKPDRASDLVCNLAPITAQFRTLKHVSTKKTASLYTETFGFPLGEYQLDDWVQLAPGACQSIAPETIDADPDGPSIWIETRFDDVNEAWFQGVWATYHFKEWSDKDFRQAIFNQYRSDVQNRGVFLCPGSQRLRAAEQTLCSEADNDGWFLPSYRLANGRGIKVIGYPGFSDLHVALSDDGQAVNQRALEEARARAREVSETIVLQASLERKWAGRALSFFITENDHANLLDLNGPLMPGVMAQGIPTSTIFDEPVPVNQRELVTAVVSTRIPNGHVHPVFVPRQIMSVFDIYEALHDHGSSRAAGIKQPIHLMLSRSVFDNQTISTRFRFNPHGPQEFDTNIGFFEAVGYTFFFQSGGWLRQQRFAYYRQMYPKRFVAAEIISFLVPLGRAFTSIGSAASKFLRRNQLARRALSGSIESALAAGYEFATAPNLIPAEVVKSRAKLSGSLGFAFGAMFPPGNAPGRSTR